LHIKVTYKFSELTDKIGLSVADPGMGGLGAPTPIDQNLRRVVIAPSVCLRPWGKLSFKSLNFGHFFVRKLTKKLSASEPPPGALHLDPRLGARALAMPPPPLANPGSATQKH